MEPSAPGWYPDPYGRHERRYWSGVRWSRHVEDHRQRTTDPLGERPSDHVSVLGAEPSPRPRTSRARRSRSPVGFVAAGVAVVLLGATAFVLLTRGGDDTVDPMTEGEPLLAAVMDALHQRSGGTLTDAEASCMADELVGSVGADRLIELRVLDGADPMLALDAREKEVAFPEAFDCLDDAGMVEFMSSTIWAREEAEGLSPEVAPCAIRRWIDGLGRQRVIYLYTTFVRPVPTPINESLNENEWDFVGNAINSCVGESSTPASVQAPAGSGDGVGLAGGG